MTTGNKNVSLQFWRPNLNIFVTYLQALVSCILESYPSPECTNGLIDCMPVFQTSHVLKCYRFDYWGSAASCIGDHIMIGP